MQKSDTEIHLQGPSWLGCDEQPPQPPTVTFEERQEEFMATRFPRLWEAFRISDIKSMIKEHNQARKLLWKLHERGHFDFMREISEKGRMIRRLREKEASNEILLSDMRP